MRHQSGFAVLGLLAILAGCAAPSKQAPPKAGDPYDIQATAAGTPECFQTSAGDNATGARMTNIARARAGLVPVVPNALLAKAAAAHACDMAARGRMTHVGSKTTGPGPRVKALGYRPVLTAENIATGPFGLNRVLAEWNASPKHLDNIMIPQLRDFGIGRAVSADGKWVFWAGVYGAPR